MFFSFTVFAQSKSLYFNQGSDNNDCVYEYSSPSWVTGNNWTLEAWFRADDVSGSSEQHIFRFSGQLYIQNGVITGQAGYGASINSNQWYHIAYVRTASSVTVYLDGNVYASDNNPDDGAQTMLYIGAYDDYGNGPFKGNIDEFRLWDEARTQQQIQDNKDKELTGNEANLLIYYDFNNGSGNSSVTDRAGGDDDGTLNNMEAGDWDTDTPAPLPVELTTFNVNIIEKNKIQLTWETATEVNNYGFNIERKSEIGEWTSLGFVEGHGNSNSPKSYIFVDNELGIGKYSYRLKQIDIDGSFEYSKEIEIDLNTPIEYSLEQNYPNPFNPTTSIQFSIPNSVQVKLVVYNVIGEQIAELLNKEMEAGYHNVQFNASNLNSGIYIYKLETSNFSKTMKMLLLK